MSDDRPGCVVERIETVDDGELGATELGGGSEVCLGSVAGRDDLAPFGPQSLDDPLVEVSEGRRHDGRLDVAEDPAPTHAVEVEGVETECFTGGQRPPSK